MPAVGFASWCGGTPAGGRPVRLAELCDESAGERKAPGDFDAPMSDVTRAITYSMIDLKQTAQRLLDAFAVAERHFNPNMNLRPGEDRRLSGHAVSLQI